MQQSVQQIFDKAKQNNKPLILDGAMGSYLQKKFSQYYNEETWMNQIIKQKPEEIIKLHEEYIQSGADILTCFSFRTNPTVEKENSQQLVNKAIDLVKKAVQNCQQLMKFKQILIAGSNAPAEDCYQKERTLTYNQLIQNHQQHISYLWESGCDFILNETFSHYDEIDIVCQYCQNKCIPYIISIYCQEDGSLLSGEQITDIFKIILKNYRPLAISLNCIFPQTLKYAIKLLFENKILVNQHFGFYINCGSENFDDDNLNSAISPEQLTQLYKKLINNDINPSFIGSCCCSFPNHTQKLREVFP